ncbi:DNA adenine methylase [Salinispora arenicola]|uniref:DNA adenine methylase n=1 Tax=Salinispora arenicola TaxID=168697 RepID=UPI00168FFB31|nr:DNA adenine methylase [Salinispora arenicola]NIL56235.1 DNA adenine methylase [Salinispora arenicola]NIL62134.1 DNA adenine methylase [Salinispora arenicola]
MKPPIGYYGSKATIADQIVRHLPPHEHYVETFAGSLAVLLAKRPSKLETVNDLDEELITFWRVLRGRPDDLARAAALTPHARAEHHTAHEPATDELEVARRVWVRLTQGRTGTLRRTGWRHYIDPGGTSMSMPAYLDAYRRRIRPAAARLARVSLEARPALDVISAYGHPDALLYVDPPYPRHTRSGTNYRHEMPDDAAHRKLADALHQTRAAVVLSGYPSELYDDLYAGWDRVDITTGTSQGGTWAARTEVIWSNRALSNQPSLLDALTPATATA